jgi:hypothetical protein
MKALITAFFLFSSLAHAMPEVISLPFAAGEVVALANWESGPHKGSESVLRLKWADKSGTPIAAPGAFKVVLWMPSMNHGSSPTLVQPAVDQQGKEIPGEFLVSRVYFTMGGEWEVRLSLQQPGGGLETRTFTLVLGGRGHH